MTTDSTDCAWCGESADNEYTFSTASPLVEGYSESFIRFHQQCFLKYRKDIGERLANVKLRRLFKEFFG